MRKHREITEVEIYRCHNLAQTCQSRLFIYQRSVSHNHIAVHGGEAWKDLYVLAGSAWDVIPIGDVEQH